MRAALFDHEYFDVYEYDNIPLDRDCYLIDEKYLEEYEQSLLKSFNNEDSEPVGYIGFVAVNKIHKNSVELSWYPNIYDRYHKVSVSLPKKEFVICVGSWRYDEKPHIFVNGTWFESIYIRLYSVFGLVDAIGVKDALRNGNLTRSKLAYLRDRIDELAENYPEISFISFADSILLKSNWTVGHIKSDVGYTFKPEILLEVFQELQTIYQETLGLSIFAIFTQGSNEYYDDALLHISKLKNHISLNSLGIPFADLLSIQSSISESLKRNIHDPAELYLDEDFYYSLKFRHEFDKQAVERNRYIAKMKSSDSFYYFGLCETFLDNLQ